jgi:hypothetical protein
MKPILLWAGAMALAGQPLFAADQTSVPAGEPAADPTETLVLPRVVIQGDFSAKGWVYARSGNTEIFSQLRAKETQGLLDDFLIFQDFVRAHFPEAALPVDQIVTIIICDSTKTYRLFGGKEDRISSTLPSSNRYILIDASEVRVIDQPIRRRYVALAFERHSPGRYPLWRELGTREILARLIIQKDRLEIGPLYSVAFGPGSLLDLEQLLNFTNQTLELAKHNGVLDGAATHQSTLFMHMCLFGSTPPFRKLREPFMIFINRLENEPLTETLFRECFGMDYVSMQNLLRAYMTGGPNVKFESRHFRFPPGDTAKAHPTRPSEISQLLEAVRAASPQTPSSTSTP